MNDGSGRPQSGEPFRRFGLGIATLRSTERSAVTSAWGVDWDEELIARDLMQNFFDANRKQLDKIVVTVRNHLVRVSAPAEFALRHLFTWDRRKATTTSASTAKGLRRQQFAYCAEAARFWSRLRQ